MEIFFNCEEDILNQKKSTTRKILQLNLISVLLNIKQRFNITNRLGFVSIFAQTSCLTRYTSQSILKLIYYAVCYCPIVVCKQGSITAEFYLQRYLL